MRYFFQSSSPKESDISAATETDSSSTSFDNVSGDIPGAEPTPPPEPSPDNIYPKIRIKTTGLLKEPLTITEITDDNPNGDSHSSKFIESRHRK